MTRHVYDELLVHHRKLWILFDPATDNVISIHTSIQNAILRKHRIGGRVAISVVTKRELETYYSTDKVVEDYLRRHSI